MSEIDQYNYELPKELIAQQPLSRRSDARLMVVERQSESIDHYHVRDLPELLNPRDTLVLNESRVIPAALMGRKPATGGRWQGLFLEADGQNSWKLLCKTRGKLKPGDHITLENRNGIADIDIVMLAKLDGGAWAVQPQTDQPWPEVLDRVGRVPLPHYIRGGQMIETDLDNYQTIYAKTPGAVAAPTAGLHFTKELLYFLKDMGVNIAQVTLHVGIGTFRPIAVERLEDHKMHSEKGMLSAETVYELNESRSQGGRIIAVGTTSVRVLETASQSGTLQPWTGDTEIFIRPPYEFRSVDALMTNFHLPKSTLLVLVRAFGGDRLMRRAYEEAVAEKYRFYSYGDAMLIL